MKIFRFVQRSAVSALLASCIASAWPAVAAQALCTGDCNGDRVVAVNELITGVGMAIGDASAASCPAMQCNPSVLGIVINCMVGAVNNALNGCGPAAPGGDGACCIGSCELGQEHCRPSLQEFCCFYAVHSEISLPISWCPPDEFDPATLQCRACGRACEGLPTPPPGELRWHRACGPPVVAYPGDPCPPSVTRCTTEELDGACGEPGVTCCEADSRCTSDICNEGLICATAPPEMCPISRAHYKHDIEYLGASGLERLHDELLAIKLANYRYNGEASSAQPHLGFIIEDVEPSQCVDGARDRVDLYGYLSMAVGAIQVQARQIEALQKEIDELRGQLNQSRETAGPERDS